MKKFLTILTSVALAMTVSTSATAKRVSCKSFKTQQEAQSYYNKRKKAGKSGWKSLDRDRDGKACENNNYGKKKSKKKLKKKKK